MALALAAASAVGLWLLFTGSAARDEMLVGVPAIALSIWFLILLERHQPKEVRLRLVDVLQGWRIVGSIFVDLFVVTVALVRDLSGRAPVASLYRAVRFEARDNRAEHIGRGVLVTAYSTAAPNMIVLGIDPESSLMVYHELKRSPIGELMKRLGARP